MLTASYSPYREAACLEHYNKIFSLCSIITERTVDAETLYMTILTERLKGRRWMPFISVSGLVQEEAVRVFYVNMFEINDTNLSF